MPYSVPFFPTSYIVIFETISMFWLQKNKLQIVFIYVFVSYPYFCNVKIWIEMLLSKLFILIH